MRLSWEELALNPLLQSYTLGNTIKNSIFTLFAFRTAVCALARIVTGFGSTTFVNAHRSKPVKFRKS